MIIIKDIKEKLLYLIFGGLTTLVNILFYYIFVNVFYIYYLIGNGLAWVISVFFAYITNRKFVFGSANNSKNEIIREICGFFSFRGLSGLIDMAFMYILVSLLGLNDTASKIAVNLLVVILNYLFSKFFVFNPK